MPIIGFLITAAQWIVGFVIARWIAFKIFWIAVLTIGLPWLLKDGVNWFWKAGESYHTNIIGWISDYVNLALSTAGIGHTINLSGVAGYMATQMGFIDYVYIVISGWAICWTLKIIGKIL